MDTEFLVARARRAPRPVTCSRCGNDRPTPTRLTQVVDGVATTRAFCAECAGALGMQATVAVAPGGAGAAARSPRERFERLLGAIGLVPDAQARLAQLRTVLASYEEYGRPEERSTAAAALEGAPGSRRWWGDPPPEFVRTFVEKFRHP